LKLGPHKDENAAAHLTLRSSSESGYPHIKELKKLDHQAIEVRARELRA
jgi:hypothetical protein